MIGMEMAKQGEKILKECMKNCRTRCDGMKADKFSENEGT